MISKAKIKFIKSLQLKKNREQTHLFLAEGYKLVGELLAKQRAHTIVATHEWIENQSCVQANEVIEVTQEELKKVSLLQHPQQVLGVFPFFQTGDDTIDVSALTLMLDGVQDPGNLGTIIRIADWFGINDIFCSHETADLYNPKVVQATMGSITRVRLHYVSLVSVLKQLPEDYPIYGTLLEGNNIYNEQLSTNGLIIMGNEGNGISTEIRQLVSHPLRIPNYPPDTATAESLNVAIATAITCAEFRRLSK